MSNPDLDRLGAARHVALTTFRADGSPVSTAMWITREGDALYALTHRGAGKVARIEADRHIEIAPSDGRGRVQGGASDAAAEVITDPAVVKRVAALLRRRYGVQYALLRGLMASRGRTSGAPVAIRMTDPTPIEVTIPTGQRSSIRK